MRSKGKLTTWNDDKGFGFITPFAGGNQVFIHIRALKNRTRRPKLGDVVTYSMSTDQQGRPCAAKATLAGDKLKPDVARPRNTPAIIAAFLFVGAVGISIATDQLHEIVGLVYVALSFVTFVAYWRDKSAAQSGTWRTPEFTLHMLGLAGGWPGALVAQETLRHKSKKATFRATFWGTVVINLALLVWLHTSGGKAFLESVVA